MNLTRKYDFLICSIILLIMVLQRREAFITSSCVTDKAEVENMFNLKYSELKEVAHRKKRSDDLQKEVMTTVHQILQDSEYHLDNWCWYMSFACNKIFKSLELILSGSVAEVKFKRTVNMNGEKAEPKEKTTNFVVARCIFQSSQKTFFISVDKKKQLLFLFQNNESSFVEELYSKVKLSAYVIMPNWLSV